MQTKQRTKLKKLPYKRSQPKPGRNELCPCGSGLKYKNCHDRQFKIAFQKKMMDLRQKKNDK
jgi:hypothetical protein